MNNQSLSQNIKNSKKKRQSKRIRKKKSIVIKKRAKDKDNMNKKMIKMKIKENLMNFSKT